MSIKQIRKHQRELKRLESIDSAFRSGKTMRVEDLCSKFEVSAKTIMRDFDRLRDQHERPLQYVARERAWRYSEPVHPMLPVTLNEGELALLVLAEHVSRAYSGNVLGGKIEATLAKVVSSLTDAVTIEVSQLVTLQTVESFPASDFDLAVYGLLAQAIQRQERVEMTYFTQGSGETKTRQIDPLHLHSARGEWYVLAFDHLRNEIRDFHLGRISNPVSTGIHFERPPGFELGSYLNTGFGMFRGSGKEWFDVIVDFDEYQARWIRQQSKVHPSAEYSDLPDKGLRITMRVGALQGVKMWVLQYGHHAQVIAPEQLRDELREELERMARMYKE